MRRSESQKDAETVRQRKGQRDRRIESQDKMLTGKEGKLERAVCQATS